MSFIHQNAIIDPSAVIGDNCYIWADTYIGPNSIIGDGCIVGKGTIICSDVKIGNNVKLQSHIYLQAGLTLETGVFIGPGVVFTNFAPGLKPIETFKEKISTIVCYGASIGSNATIVGNCIIGEWAMIGAGAYIDFDIPAFKMAIGHPAKIVGRIDQNGKKISDR